MWQSGLYDQIDEHVAKCKEIQCGSLILLGSKSPCTTETQDRDGTVWQE